MISFLYDLIYLLPAGLISIILCEPYLSVPEKHVPILPFLMVCVVATSGLRYLSKAVRWLLTGGTAAILVGIVWVAGREDRILYLIERRYLFYIFGLVLVNYLLVRIGSRFVNVKRVMALVILIGFIAVLVRGMEITKLIFLPAVFLLMLIWVEEIQRRWVKSGYTDKKGHLVNSAAALAVICVLVYFLPAPVQPYDWKFAVNIWERTVESVQKWRGKLFYGEEEYGITSFSDAGTIGGDFFNNKKEIMEVSGGKLSGGVFYLSGRTFDTFTGKEWTADTTEMSERMLDTAETLCAVEQYDPEYTYDYVLKTDVEIKNRLHNTKYLFVPGKMVVSGDFMPDQEYTEFCDSIQVNENLEYGADYKARYYRLNRQSECFRDLVLHADDLDVSKEHWDSLLIKYMLHSNADYTYDRFLEYRQQMQTRYSSSIALSESLQEELQSVYEGAESEWDRLERLEAWLQTFSYNTQPGSIPEKVNSPETFLDYVLLEQKEGYCIHYATAFVLLARAEGLPARYVQGYRVPRKIGAPTLVTADMGHAWAEVYITNVGWIPFDPTPGFSIGSGWAMKERAEEKIQSDEGIEAGRKEYADDENRDTEEEDEEEEELPEKVPLLKRINFKLIGFPMLLLMLFTIGYLSCSYLISRIRYSKLDQKGKILYLYKQNLKCLSSLGYRLQQGETLQEFIVRIREGMDAGEVFDFLEMYETITYSENAIQQDMVILSERCNKVLQRLVWKKRKEKISFGFRGKQVAKKRGL